MNESQMLVLSISAHQCETSAAKNLEVRRRQGILILLFSLYSLLNCHQALREPMNSKLITVHWF